MLRWPFWFFSIHSSSYVGCEGLLLVSFVEEKASGITLFPCDIWPVYFLLQLQLHCQFLFPWLLTVFLLTSSPTQVTVKLLQGIFCLISCNSRYPLTKHGFSCFQKIIVLEETMIITLYSLQIAEMLWKTTRLGKGTGFFVVVCFFLEAICFPVLDRWWYVLSVCDADSACVVSALLQGLA